MTFRRKSALATALGVVTLASGTVASAGTGVSPARGATRSALVHAFVVQDGSSVGISGEYVGGSRPMLGVVCQKTPDAGTVRFLFKSSGRSWRFLFSTRTTSIGSSLERRLEQACR